MTNDSIRIGILNYASAMERLSKLSYKELEKYRNVPSYYKISAISTASGIIASKNRSIKGGRATRDPCVKRPLLVSCYGFKIMNGKLRIPFRSKKYEYIPLNAYVLKVLQDRSLIVRSFTLSLTSLSLCIAKEVREINVTSAVGIDRNLRNLTVGNEFKVAYYNLTKVVEIDETAKDVVKPFKRNNYRIRKQVASKHGKRKKESMIF